MLSSARSLNPRLPTCARASPLSMAQVREVQQLLDSFYPHVSSPVRLECAFLPTKGDIDQTTSLRHLDKTDFFTYELDARVLSQRSRIAIHSAKDLPEPLPKGLAVIALTKGVDPRDALVFRDGQDVKALPSPVIATSSQRREEAVRALFPKARFVDLRGTIEKRLKKLQEGVDGVVVAEAALLRLNLHPPRIYLPLPTAPYQGQLAIVAREGDEEMSDLFAPLDSRRKLVLYTGLDPSRYPEKVFHYPLIETHPLALPHGNAKQKATHLVLTSRQAAVYWLQSGLHRPDLQVLAIGKATSEVISPFCARPPLIASQPTQEGVMALLRQISLEGAYILYPHSKKARPDLQRFIEKSVACSCFALYDTLTRPVSPIPLDPFEKIVFTSPSTVQAFLSLYQKFPAMALEAIGPITLQSVLAAPS